MSEFTLPDMSCGHCVASITKAIEALDAQAKLQFDLPSHKLQVESQLSEAQLAALLTEAGYPPAA
ncbi:heavy-metal-associated domain-containing protein [Paucibacter soli]|uniref:heavy-metal-associated domain-containing protein n=1 Tax=Paucibacter soli TaxID=3133433 RepID=UPI003096E271